MTDTDDVNTGNTTVVDNTRAFETVIEKPEDHQDLVGHWCVVTYTAKAWALPPEGQQRKRVVWVYNVNDSGIDCKTPVSPETGIRSSGSFCAGAKKQPGAQYGGDIRCENIRIRLAKPEEFEGLSTY